MTVLRRPDLYFRPGCRLCLGEPQEETPGPMTTNAEPAPRGLYQNAYVLLTLTAAMWGANTNAGRLAVGEVSPMALTFLRWIMVVAILALFYRDRLVADWPVLRQRLPYFALMGAGGYTGFNAMFYLAAHYTTAVNLAILQGAIPVFVFVIAAVLHGTRIRLGHALGMAATLAGVLIVAGRGDLAVIRHLTFNIGDLMILAACFGYALYTIALTRRPEASGVGIFAAMAGFACLTSVPLVAIEAFEGTLQWPTPKGWAVLAFIALFPSFISQLFYMRGVTLIGPARAGVFANLVPVFGAAFAVALLGEPFGWYHAAGLVLVIGGIVWVQRA